jgi:hypothetical protein
MDWKRRVLRKSGFDIPGNLKDLLPSAPGDLGQSYPQHYPQRADAVAATLTEPLGAPLSIREVAGVIGCSPWTVRQRYLPAGLPHHRLTPNGKLIFYRNQVIRWLITRQQKGGTIS